MTTRGVKKTDNSILGEAVGVKVWRLTFQIQRPSTVSACSGIVSKEFLNEMVGETFTYLRDIQNSSKVCIG